MTGAIAVIGEGLVELGIEPGRETDVAFGFGGDAPNAAVMAARAGARARICGRVGDDALGRRLCAFWTENGIELDCVTVDPQASTGLYVNEPGTDGLMRFDYHRTGSAGSRLALADVGDGFLTGAATLHLTGITLAISDTAREAALETAQRARRAGVDTSLAVNHRPVLGGDPALLREVASKSTIVFVSDAEAESVFEVDLGDLPATLPKVRELVVTTGAGGAVLHTAEDSINVAAPPVATVDTAGAGDALAGAYLARRAGGASPPAALEFAVVAASLSCSARGCALSYPTSTEVELTLRGRL